uniref:Uncharacterized protein n=2 Tax=viral metagenome TaxID=1070528 RepID=A0A6M3XW83_9ZZZZ
MSSISLVLGKGLREPCSPFRETNVFGAELNTPDAGSWNCLPAIVGGSTRFDLSSIRENHEVVVALATVSGAAGGVYRFNFKYYKDAPRTKLFEYSFDVYTGVGSWAYAYAYIGWVPHEINRNGDYSVELTVSGAESYQRTIYFTVSGIPGAEPEPPESGGFMAAIVTALNTVSRLFYHAYVETYGWGGLFNYLATPFYYGAEAFSTLAWRFSDFFSWLLTKVNEWDQILSWDTVWSYILSYVPNLEEIRDWFSDWPGQVLTAIDTWWTSTMGDVAGWIEIAAQLLRDQVNGVNTWLVTLQSDWDAFKGRIPTIDGVISWWADWAGNVTTLFSSMWSNVILEVQALINSAFIEREPFWAGWQDWRDQVAEFFTDPEDWLYNRLDSFFERFW